MHTAQDVCLELRRNASSPRINNVQTTIVRHQCKDQSVGAAQGSLFIVVSYQPQFIHV
jgi:hypothetical protein